jgi:hypothetical protein
MQDFNKRLMEALGVDGLDVTNIRIHVNTWGATAEVEFILDDMQCKKVLDWVEEDEQEPVPVEGEKL